MYAALTIGNGLTAEEVADLDEVLVRDPAAPEPPPEPPKSEGTRALMNLLGVGPPPTVGPPSDAAEEAGL